MAGSAMLDVSILQDTIYAELFQAFAPEMPPRHSPLSERKAAP